MKQLPWEITGSLHWGVAAVASLMNDEFPKETAKAPQ
jgi:hypothetical protein